ncbi:MAG TPA: hypothetical protein VHA57_07735 [Actinomycetota bacterium]|nr:hypothetical protein [Actinomycetota bacterium]
MVASALSLALLLPFLAMLPARGATVLNLSVDDMTDQLNPGGCAAGGAGSAGSAVAAQATGLCSLREAIVEVDQAAVSGTVDATITMPAGTYTFALGKPAGQPDSAAGGDLVISNNANVTINGAGASATGTVIDAHSIDRQFAVLAGGSLTLNNLFLQNGSATTSHAGGSYPAGAGGSVLVAGNLTVGGLNSGVVFDNNRASGSGGAIQGELSTASILVMNSYFLSNAADDDGGAISTIHGLDAQPGGQLGVSNTYFDGNDAFGLGPSIVGAGGAIAFGGPGYVYDSTVHNNAALHEAGGILTFQADELVNDTIVGNAVTATGSAGGGGVMSNFPTTSQIIYSTLVDNTAPAGEGTQISSFPNGGLALQDSYVQGAGPVCNPRYTTGDLSGNLQTDSSCDPAIAAVAPVTATASPLPAAPSAPLAVLPTVALPAQQLQAEATAGGAILAYRGLGTPACQVGATAGFVTATAGFVTATATGPLSVASDELGNPRPNGVGCDAGAVQTAQTPSPGTVLSWGSPFQGDLANSLVDIQAAGGTTPVFSNETGLRPDQYAVKVAAGQQDSFVLTNDGQVYSWGDNTDTQLGYGIDAPFVEPGEPISLPVSATAVAASPTGFTGLAIGTDGNVYGWGDNTSGQEGTANLGQPVVAQRITGFPPGTAIRQVSVGGDHDLALSSTGTVYAWGSNSSGQLGPDAPPGSESGEVFAVPLPLATGETAVLVDAGVDDSFAVTSQGRVFGWGGNTDGELGTGSFSPPTAQPTLVALPAGAKVTAVTSGSFFSEAMTTSAIYSWGMDNVDQLGTGPAGSLPSPQPTPGQSVQDDPTPSQVPLPSGSTVESIAGGGAFSVAHVLTLGGDEILGWGLNSSGQLGDGDTESEAGTPVVTKVPVGVAIDAVAAGLSHALMVVGPPGASASVALATAPSVDAGAQIVPESAVSPAALASPVTSSATAAASTPLGSIPLASIPLASIPLASIPLGSIPLGSIPLASIPLGSIPLASIPLSEAPLNTSAGTTWAALLSCTGQPVGPNCSNADASIPEQTLTLTQVLALPQVQSLPLASIDLSSTPLASIPLASIAMGSVPLASIPIPGSGTPAQNWCAVITAAGQSCAAGSALDPSTATLLSVALSGIPLASIPLGSITLGGILPALQANPQASPLGSIPLASIDFSSTPLGSIPLGSINLGSSSPVSSTLAALPLGSIPLGSIPLGSIPLGSIPLGSIPLGSIPLGSIPLASIANPAQLITCQPGGTSNPCPGSTLSALSPGDFVPGANVQLLCSLDDQSSGRSLCLDPGAVTSLAQMFAADPAAFTNPATLTTIAELCTLTDTVTGSLLCSEAGYQTTLSQLAGGSPGFGYGGASLLPLLESLPQTVLNALLVGDLLTGLLPRASYPWQQLDLQSAPLQQSANNGGVSTYTAGIAVTGSPTTVSLAVTVPPGFAYRPGTSALVGSPIADPTISGSTLTWMLPDLPVGASNLTFNASSALTLGAAQATAAVTAIGQPPAPAAGTTTVVTDAFAPGYHTPSTPSPLALGNLNLGYITQPGVDDWFSLAVTAGQELSIELSNLPADYDLALYSPATTPLRNAPVQTMPPVTDPNTLDAPSAQAAPPVAAGDVALTNQPVYAISDNRGTTNEVINTSPLPAGTYLVEVSGYNGAASPNPYVLRADVLNAQAQPSCVASRTLSGQQPLIPMPALPANVNTIFLADTERLASLYTTADANAILADAARAAADSADGVIGAVIPVETTGTVAASYAAWDANRCSIAAANAVVSDIGKVVDTLRTAHPTIRNVVILGDDSQIPMARVPDTTTLSNERGFAQDFSGPANELTAAEAAGDLLTDAPYVNSTPLGVGSGSLFLPEIAIGRLVSTPAQIENALTRFVTSHGGLNDTTGLSTGYDFLADGAQAVAANLGLVPARTITQLVSNPDCTPQPPAVGGPATGTVFPVGDCWTASNLETALSGNPNLVGLNAHFDPQRLLPANGNQTGNQTTGLFTTADLRSMFASDPGLLTGSLLFSMGCHAGLELPANEFGQSIDSWDQTFADEGAIWVANTGYGYGDTESVALSEQLMADFAANLNETMTIGDALTFAKQTYAGGLAVVSPYDMKVLMESTFYGLPMYHLHVPPPAPAPRAAGPATTVNPITGLTEAPVSVTLPVGTGPGQLGLVTTPQGNYYQVNATGPVTGTVQATEYRPLQPKLTLDVTQPAPTGPGLALVAHGVVLTGLCSQDVNGFKPKIVRPVIDSGSTEPPLTPADATFPTQLQNVTTFLQPNGTHQQVVLVPGQFNSGNDTERLFTCLNASVEYANPSDPVAATDFTPPTIVSSEGVVTGGTAAFRVSVTAGAAAEPVKQVTVLFTSGNGAWQRLALAQGAGGVWSGEGPAGGTNLAWFVQAVDGAGNVSVASDKGTYFAAVPAPTGGSVSLTVPPPPASGVYPGPVPVTMTDTAGTPISYTLDGTTVSGVASGTVITVTGDGVHLLSAATGAGAVSTIVISIGSAPPTATIASPVTGTALVLHQAVTATFSCTAAVSCTALVDGTIPVASGGALPTSAVGAHTLVVTAANAAGVRVTAQASYTVGYQICHVQEVLALAHAPVPIELSLCDAQGVNLSRPGIAVTATTLDGMTAPANLVGLGSRAFVNIPPVPPTFRPPVVVMPSYGYLLKGLARGTHILGFIAGADPVPHSVTFTLSP